MAAANDRSVKLFEFSGDPVLDRMTVTEFVSHVEMSRLAGGWTDAITAEKVKLRLTGPARTWLQNRIRAETAGLAAFDPPVAGNVKPPGLRALLIERFMPTTSAGEQQRLRASLVQGDQEPVHIFYDRVENVQYLLDMEFPETFRRESKAAYDIVHERMVCGNFIAGLRADIRKHVTTINVNNAIEARTAAVAYEKARCTNKVPATMSGASGEDETSLEKRIAALEMQRSQPRDSQNQTQNRAQGGKLADEGCFYCGFIGHIKPVCRMRQADEAQGIYQKRAVGYQPGRVSSRSAGRGRGNQDFRGRGRGRGYTPYRGGGQPYRGSQQFRGRGYVHASFPQQQQQVQPTVPQPGSYPEYEIQGGQELQDPTYYEGPNMGALRFTSGN